MQTINARYKRCAEKYYFFLVEDEKSLQLLRDIDNNYRKRPPPAGKGMEVIHRYTSPLKGPDVIRVSSRANWFIMIKDKLKPGEDYTITFTHSPSVFKQGKTIFHGWRMTLNSIVE